MDSHINNMRGSLGIVSRDVLTIPSSSPFTKGEKEIGGFPIARNREEGFGGCLHCHPALIFIVKHRDHGSGEKGCGDFPCHKRDRHALENRVKEDHGGADYNG